MTAREAREAANLTLEQAARLIRCSPDYLRRAENGRLPGGPGVMLVERACCLYARRGVEGIGMDLFLAADQEAQNTSATARRGGAAPGQKRGGRRTPTAPKARQKAAGISGKGGE